MRLPYVVSGTAGFLRNKQVVAHTSQMQQRRSFFFSLWQTKNDRQDDQYTTQQLPQAAAEAEAERIHKREQDDTHYRLSLQHAHSLGPWQAISEAVQSHYYGNSGNWKLATASDVTGRQPQDSTSSIIDDSQPPPSNIKAPRVYRVLDLACGPRGEPGTTIAQALPWAVVHCTDLCFETVAAVPVHMDHWNNEPQHPPPPPSHTHNNHSRIRTNHHDPQTNAAMSTTTPHESHGTMRTRGIIPQNLTKSVANLEDLSLLFETESVDALVCCYGYGLAANVPQALREAYRVLAPGGILVLATWQRSPLSLLSRDILAAVQAGSGGGTMNVYEQDYYSPEGAFLPPRLHPVADIAFAGTGEWEAMLIAAGFDAANVTSRYSTYPFDLGKRPNQQLAMGTVLIRPALERLGAFDGSTADGAGGWTNLAEEAFWTNISRYSDTLEDGSIMLNDNTFQLTVSTKSLP